LTALAVISPDQKLTNLQGIARLEIRGVVLVRVPAAGGPFHFTRFKAGVSAKIPRDLTAYVLADLWDVKKLFAKLNE